MLGLLSLRLRVFLFFGLLGIGCPLILGFGLWFAESRFDPADPVSGFVTAGLIAGFPILGLITGVWYLFDENVARPIEAVSSAMRARAHGGVCDALEASAARYLGDLAPAASAVTGTLASARSSVEEAVSRQTAQLATQTERLTALVGDVPVGLVVCTPAHQVVFYNAPARELLSGSGQIRLGAPVFELLREGPIRKTYDRLRASGKGVQDAEILLSTTGCARALSAHMRLVRGAMDITGPAPGYVLTLRDVTADLGLHRERERLLGDIVERLRRPADQLRVLSDPERGGSGDEAELLACARDLSGEIESITQAYDAAWHKWWPMQDVLAADLIDGLRAHLGETGPVLDAPPPDMMLHCDGVAVIDLLAALVSDVRRETGAEVLSLSITPDTAGALLRLGWQGQTLQGTKLEALLTAPLEGDALSLTGREVLDHHGTDLQTGQDESGTAWLALPLPAPPVPSGHAPDIRQPQHFVPERAAVFDFDLLTLTDHAAIDDTPLSKLKFVVFDTETTGLDPMGGDEIVQIAALRLVNGRIVPGEEIDQLVDPERPIPAGATAVHGISAAMVAGAPTIREAGRRFHSFAGGAVLVAHNAPFDMAFFHRHGPDMGLRFDNPVLDTVLLSAVLFGQQAEHTLDALAARFGVTIPDEVRHTAMGDTRATAEVFLRMIPMLEAKGMTSFGAVLTAMERNSRLMKEMRARVGA